MIAVLFEYEFSGYDQHDVIYVLGADILCIFQSLAGAMPSRIHLYQTILWNTISYPSASVSEIDVNSDTVRLLALPLLSSSFRSFGPSPRRWCHLKTD